MKTKTSDQVVARAHYNGVNTKVGMLLGNKQVIGGRMILGERERCIIRCIDCLHVAAAAAADDDDDEAETSTHTYTHAHMHFFLSFSSSHPLLLIISIIAVVLLLQLV